MQGRGPWLFLIVALAIGTWLWFDQSGEPERVAPTPAAAPAGSESSPVLEVPSRPEKLPAEAPRSGNTEPEAGAPDTEPKRAPKRPVGAAAVLRVVLDLAPEWVVRGTVYAHIAGARGGDEAFVPKVATKNRRQVDLPLPAQGRWDVGYVCPFGHVLAIEVDAEEGPVRLACHDAEPIELRLVGSGPARVRAGYFGDDAVPFPGRGQRSTVHALVEFDAAGRARTPPLRPGLAYDIAVYGARRLRGNEPGFDWVPEPRTARAGDDVIVRRAALGLVRVLLSLAEPMPRTWSEGMTSNMWVAARASGARLRKDRFAGTWLTKQGVLQAEHLLLPLPPGTYTITVGVGHPFHDRVQEVVVEAGRTYEIDGALRPNPDFVPGGTPVPPSLLVTRTTLRVLGARSGELSVFAELRDDGGEIHVESHTFGLGDDTTPEIASSQRFLSARAFRFPDRASGSFGVPRRGEVTVALEPAGMLLMVPERRPDPALGALRIRSAHGHALPWAEAGTSLADPSPDLRVARELEVGAGHLVGPLAVGVHRFEVWLGPVRIGTAEAEVAAGVLRPLSIRLPAANLPK